jgi:probable F420-dependent oxidoreductase
VKIGVKLPTSGPLALADNIGRVAVECDRLGYDSLWVHDHVHRRMENVKAHFVAGSPEAWEQWEGPLVPNMFESVTTLFYAAGLTKNLELGTSVVVLPLRHPVWFAKYLACLDQFSGGRVICGVGAGGGAYAIEELAALGRSELFEPRGRVVDEWLEIMRGIWSEDEFSYDGEFLQVKDAVVFPKPIQKRLPIVYGGNGPRVRRRIGRMLDGWLPMFYTPDEIRQGREAMIEEGEKHGRSASEFQVVSEHWLSISRDADEAQRRSWSTRNGLWEYTIGQLHSKTQSKEGEFWVNKWEEKSDVSLVGDPATVGELVVQYRDAGADHIVLRVLADNLDQMLESIQLFKEEVWDRLPAGAVAAS